MSAKTVDFKEDFNMKNYTNTKVSTTAYNREFWNAMLGKPITDRAVLDEGHISTAGSFALPEEAYQRFDARLTEQNIFRQVATVINLYGGHARILTKDTDDTASWIPENSEIPVTNSMDDFSMKDIGTHKLAELLRLDESFVHDAAFDFQNYLVDRMADTFSRSEEDAFINGTGVNMPTGILNAASGAETGVNTSAITADNIISLYFSLDKKYRKNAVWMMNDKTALVLRTLKDSTGNYLWHSTDDTLLGKRVLISNYMPDTDAGNSPVVFGDFSYYWIIGRYPFSVRPLIEKFAITGQVGYLAFEFLDAKLTRREAVKALTVG